MITTLGCTILNSVTIDFVALQLQGLLVDLEAWLFNCLAWLYNFKTEVRTSSTVFTICRCGFSISKPDLTKMCHEPDFAVVINFFKISLLKMVFTNRKARLHRF